MANNKLAIAFATECLGWTCTTFGSFAERPNGTVEFDKAWRNADGGWVLGIDDMLPPFGEDTPEGWAAHRRWVEPWIEEMGCHFIYSERHKKFILYNGFGFTNLHKAFGPLTAAAISACLKLARKENGDGEAPKTDKEPNPDVATCSACGWEG